MTIKVKQDNTYKTNSLAEKSIWAVKELLVNVFKLLSYSYVSDV